MEAHPGVTQRRRARLRHFDAWEASLERHLGVTWHHHGKTESWPTKNASSRRHAGVISASRERHASVTPASQHAERRRNQLGQLDRREHDVKHRRLPSAYRGQATLDRTAKL